MRQRKRLAYLRSVVENSVETQRDTQRNEMILSNVLTTAENSNDPSGSVNAKFDKLVNREADYLKNMSNMMCGNKRKQENDGKRLYNLYPSDSRYGQQFINSRTNNTEWWKSSTEYPG